VIGLVIGAYSAASHGPSTASPRADASAAFATAPDRPYTPETGFAPFPSREAPQEWLKGQLHLHTASHFDDSTTVDGMVQRYQELGFDFIVVTDHNRITTHPGLDSIRVFPGVELSQDSDVCRQGPHDPVAICRLHIGALFTDVVASNQFDWGHLRSGSPIDLSKFLVDTAHNLNGVVMINHPTQYWAVDDTLLGEQHRAGAVLIEIANMGPGIREWNAGTADRPGTEALWDQALSAGAILYGVASDDAHAPDEAGFGWVMVLAENTEASIRQALTDGDFYSSTGVTLSRVVATDTSLSIEVDSDQPHSIEFIGREGRILASVQGVSASFPMPLASGSYVRAVVTSPDGSKAWTQPVRALFQTP